MFVARLKGGVCVTLLTDAGVATSKSEAARLIRSGGIYVNDRRDRRTRSTSSRVDEAIEGQLFVLRRGKRDNFLVRITES